MGLWKLSANRRFYICTFNSSRFVTTATNLIISGRVSLITIHNLYASTNKTEIIQIQAKPKSFKSKQNPNHSNPNKTQITANHSSTGRVSKATTQRKPAERWGSAHNVCAFSNSWSSPELILILLRSKLHSPSPLSSEVLAAVCLGRMKHSTEKVYLTAPTAVWSAQRV